MIFLLSLKISVEQQPSQFYSRNFKQQNRNIWKKSFITVSFSASNYIISGTSGFETAKACAVIEDTPRSNENQISIDDNYDLPVSVKPGKVFISLI